VQADPPAAPTVTQKTHVIVGGRDIPDTVIVSGSGTATTVQYGDMTPEEPEPVYEKFSPYASVLANVTYRSDPSFDASKVEFGLGGNYTDLYVSR
jgi:hypothetical protein